MDISPPMVFTEICRQFHQDIDKVCPDLESMADFAVKGLRAREREILSTFLDELLGGQFTKGEIRAVWRRSPADVYFRDVDQLINLLRLIRARLTSQDA